MTRTLSPPISINSRPPASASTEDAIETIVSVSAFKGRVTKTNWKLSRMTAAELARDMIARMSGFCRSSIKIQAVYIELAVELELVLGARSGIWSTGTSSIPCVFLAARPIAIPSMKLTKFENVNLLSSRVLRDFDKYLFVL